MAPAGFDLFAMSLGLMNISSLKNGLILAKFCEGTLLSLIS